MEHMTFQQMIAITREVIAAFDRAEQRPWTVEVSMIELTKQVGDLAKRIMTAEQRYLPDRAERSDYRASVDDIGDELADIFYCVIRIAEHYNVDLERAHVEARRREMRYVGQEPSF